MQRKYHFVLDADGVLTTSFGKFDKDPETYPAYQWFSQNKLLIQTSKPNILHPGTYEFILYLLNKPDTRLSFIAGWTNEKLKLYVERLLTRILGEDGYKKVCQNIGYLSKNGYLNKSYFVDEYSFKLFKQNQPAIRDAYFSELLQLNSSDTITIVITNDQTLQCTALQKSILLTAGANQRHFEHYHVRNKPSEEDLIHANHVFYIVGMIESHLEDVVTSRPAQYYDRDLYLKGLETLQKINPALRLYGPQAKGPGL